MRIDVRLENGLVSHINLDFESRVSPDDIQNAKAKIRYAEKEDSPAIVAFTKDDITGKELTMAAAIGYKFLNECCKLEK